MAYYKCFTALWILTGLTGWVERRSIHALTPILIINHPSSASSIYCDPWHPPRSIYMPDSLFAQPLSKSSWVYLLVWHIRLHTPYISSPNHCFIFATHAQIIATCFAQVLRLYHLIRQSLNSTWNSIFYLNATQPSDHCHLCLLKCHFIFFS